MANHICVGSISGSGHAEQILLVGWMEKHNRTVVTFFNPVGNTWNSIDGDKIIHLITALSKVCCKLLKGLRTVTVGLYHRNSRRVLDSGGVTCCEEHSLFGLLIR